MNRTELRKRRTAVLMGGESTERDVSLRTGAAVLNALRSEGYDVVGIDPDQNLPARLRAEKIEQAFVALHGRYGEDGTVQGLLEMMRIPYTGSGVLASSLAVDKVMTKQMLLYHEMPTPGFVPFCRGGDRTALLARCRHFPLVVKPAREGSTIGISIVHDEQQLLAGLDVALGHDDLILVEDFIPGDEVTVSVLNGAALPIIQIVPKSGFYDYRAKYTSGQTEYLLPAPLDNLLYSHVQRISVEACRMLGCRGAARVDFMVRDKEFYCLEVNTIPGMTETSLLPKAAAQAGIAFGELVQRILQDADLRK